MIVLNKTILSPVLIIMLLSLSACSDPIRDFIDKLDPEPKSATTTTTTTTPSAGQTPDKVIKSDDIQGD